MVNELEQVRPIQFDFTDVVGLSDNQLNQHYQLYLGYIKLHQEILRALKNKTQTNYEYRGLKEGETYALNGIVLHELYFGNLGQSTVTPSIKLEDLIIRDFGSYNEWCEDFLRTGKTARGWAVLAYDYRDMRLHNVLQDSHNTGSVWDAIPLLVMDVYEHAYMIDYGIDKDKYLDVFSRNIDWAVVNQRFQELHPFTDIFRQ